TRQLVRGDRRDPWFGWLLTSAAVLAVILADNLLLLFIGLQLLTLAWSGALDETARRRRGLRLSVQIVDIGLLLAAASAIQSVGTSAFSGVPSDTFGLATFLLVLLPVVVRVAALAWVSSGPQAAVTFEPSIAWVAPAGYLLLRLLALMGGRLPDRATAVALFGGGVLLAIGFATLALRRPAGLRLAAPLLAAQAAIAVALSAGRGRGQGARRPCQHLGERAAACGRLPHRRHEPHRAACRSDRPPGPPRHHLGKSVGDRDEFWRLAGLAGLRRGRGAAGHCRLAAGRSVTPAPCSRPHRPLADRLGTVAGSAARRPYLESLPARRRVPGCGRPGDGTTVIVYFPCLLFAAGTLVAYGSTGLRRQAATIATVAASGWSLVLLVDPGSGTWAIGPIVATLLLPRAGQRAQSNFEGLTRRVITLAVAVLMALFLATRLPIGENPILLSAVPWLLGALGTAWFVSPIDEPERLQGQALMIAAVAVLILIAVPTGPLTAGVAGAMALMPIAGER